MDEMNMDILRERINERCTDKHIKHKQLAEKSGVDINTINSWFRKNERTEYGKEKKRIPQIDKLYRVAVALDVSLDYLTGRVDYTNVGNKEMSEATGLSNTAIECLREWRQDQQQNNVFSPQSHETDTLNMILEYCLEKRKENAKSGQIGKNIYNLFHYIGNFFNAHKFKRVQQDLIRYGHGSHYKPIEIGDTITKSYTGETETIEKLCTPINSQSHRGEDAEMVDIINTENNDEQYYISVPEIYREYSKSQIESELKKIGGIE